VKTYEIEVTDTFGGDANYSWVRRYRHAFHGGATRLEIVRKLKALAGLNGVICRVNYWDGECGQWFVVGSCVCFFITFQEAEQ